ncbi:MAG TPA: hypothetical protein VL486_07330 [Verrucomicrobiae bacterium]|nr:hypothetical protein [Verrucomicrobiae bacterium]
MIMNSTHSKKIGSISVVTWRLGAAALVDPVAVGLAAGPAFLLLRCRVNSAWLVLGGAIIGLVVALMR